MLYVLATGVVAVCVCMVFLFFICLLAGATDGSLPGFPTEAVGCFMFGFYRYSSQLFGFFWFSCLL